ncbi:MAG: hypothetical protein M3P31_02725 [Actinomycetota bacterium]|nr:hypothetical protein [Actinomycetota bacterium]
MHSMTHLSEDGQPRRWTVVPDRQAICRSDDDTVMGIFGPGYVRHQYREWLLTTVADLLDDDLAISSAGLLRGGVIAWVEVSTSCCESVEHPVRVARSRRTSVHKEVDERAGLDQRGEPDLAHAVLGGDAPGRTAPCGCSG